MSKYPHLYSFISLVYSAALKPKNWSKILKSDWLISQSNNLQEIYCKNP